MKLLWLTVLARIVLVLRAGVKVAARQTPSDNSKMWKLRTQGQSHLDDTPSKGCWGKKGTKLSSTRGRLYRLTSHSLSSNAGAHSKLSFQ